VQVAAWLVLVQVKNKRERSLLVRPLGVEKTSRLGSRDPVASGVKCGSHGGKNGKMRSWTVSWLSLKTKVEPGLRGSRVMSGDWQRLHRVRGVSGGSPENHWVPWLIHKSKTEEPKTEVQQLQTGLTGGSNQSDRWVLVWPVRSTGLTGVRRCSTETSKQRTHVRIARLASRLSKFAVTGHPSDGAMTKISEFTLEGHVSLIS
jgi:hypothetical protein